jgi:hypothetical protein
MSSSSTATLFYYQGIHAHYVPNGDGTRDFVLQKMPKAEEFKAAAAAGTPVQHNFEWRVVIPSSKLAEGHDVGTWVHWTFVIDGETGHSEIFRFGQNVAEGGVPPLSRIALSAVPTEEYMLFGNAIIEGSIPGTVAFAPFNGQLTDLRIWDRTLDCRESAVADYW